MNTNTAAPLPTKVDVSSSVFSANYKEMNALCSQLQERASKAFSEGTEKAIARHRSRGQMLGRERITALLDEDSPFLELGLFAGFGNPKTPRTGVCGIGLVHGIEVLVLSDSPTVRGAAKNQASVQVGLRALQVSMENRLPVINLIQTAGADLTQQDKVFHKGGEMFRMLAERAKLRLPTVSVVFGSSTAGGAYHPGMSDYVIMIKKQAKVYLGGPPLVKMATGEEVTHEILGGAHTHATISGVADYLADNETHALRMARDIAATFDFAAIRESKARAGALVCNSTIEEPIYSRDELLGIVSPEVKHPFDMHEVIARIVDGSRASLFKPNYGKTLVACWAEVFGNRVGILANNGVLFSDAAQKGAQFIALCNQKNTPILFFHNITGFMVGTQSEHGGLIKHGSLMVNAVANSKVPHISVLMGASFGAGNYAMCGRAYHPRFLFSYPNAKCSVMGAEQLAGVLDQVTGERLRAAKAQLSELKDLGDEATAKEMAANVERMANEAQKRNAAFQRQVEKQMDVYTTSALGLDDGIIDPRDTRLVLGICLSVIANAPVQGGNIAGVSRL